MVGVSVPRPEGRSKESLFLLIGLQGTQRTVFVPTSREFTGKRRIIDSRFAAVIGELPNMNSRLSVAIGSLLLGLLPADRLQRGARPKGFP